LLKWTSASTNTSVLSCWSPLL